MTALHLYDFDGTLFRSPQTPAVWDGDWWSDIRSLMPPCVPDRPGNDWWVSETVAAARNSIADPDVLAVMATGRKDQKEFRYRIPELLRNKKLHFDVVRLNSGGMGAVRFKLRLIASLLRLYPDIDAVHVWDDRPSHLPMFKKVAEDAGLDPSRVVLHLVRVQSKDPGCSAEDVLVDHLSNRKPAYLGVFLDAPSKAILAHEFSIAHDEVHNDHMTVAMPAPADAMALVGRTVRMVVTGYAEDERAQAVLVSPVGIRVENTHPHITISTATGVSPKYSNTLLAQGPIQFVPSGIVLTGILDVYPRRTSRMAAQVAIRWLQRG